MKSEPSEYSIDDLRRDKRVPWYGVRNYQARNFMRDEMHSGDTVLFYHSSCPVPGVAGIAEVAGTSYPDATQFERKFRNTITLPQLREIKDLKNLIILRPGNRLSITPVTEAEFMLIATLGD